MKQVFTALAGAVAVAFTQLAIAQGASSEGSYDRRPYPAYGARQEQQYEPSTQQNYRHDGRPSVRGDDDPPRNDWRYPGKPDGDG